MRRRLIVAIAGVAATAVILFAIPLALVLQTSNRDEELLRLQRDTVAATRAIDLGTASDPVELPPSHDRLAVYDTTGRRVTGRGPAQADETVQATFGNGSPAATSADGRLISAVPLLARERVTGVLRAERSDAAALRAAHRTWIALTALAALLLALAAMAAAVLGRRLARPLERLAAAARRLGDGNFAARAPRAGISEADEIAAALDHTAQRLGDLIARERTFSTDASHQLRTPLAALRLELEAIELHGDPPPPEIQRALAQVERLQSTVETFLAVARDAPRSSGRSDLRLLLDDLRDRWQGRLAAEARPLRTRWLTDARIASASATVVTEILDVLADNAHHHGGGPVTVTVRATEHWLAIDVADDGPGFSGDIAAVFDRRVPRSGGGHGIGLALAEALADAEGGRLSITQASPPIVTLWLARGGEAARSAAKSDAAAGRSHAAGSASAPI